MSLNSPGNEPESPAPEPLAQGYWARLTGQMDRLQASVDELVAVSQASESQTEALLRHLTDPARAQGDDQRLADILEGQETAASRWEVLSQSVAELGQAVAKLNRTQYRANALAEMKDQQVTTAIGVLQDVAARREQLREARAMQEQERATALRAEGRGEFAAELLPVLDGLERALESGQALLERQAEQARSAPRSVRPQPGARPGLSQRLSWAIRGGELPPGVAGQPPAPAPPASSGDEISAALHAWLQGLELVRARFLGLLATAGIYPIEAAGQPFDPRLHLAMATEARPDLPHGAVVAVLSKGYRQRGRVLRYAEVAVNRLPEPQAAPIAENDSDAAPGALSKDGEA